MNVVAYGSVEDVPEVDPKDVPRDEVLAAVFDLKGTHLYVWLDHDVDEVKVTRFPDVPRDLREERPGLAWITGSVEPPEREGRAVVLRYGPAASGLWEAGAFFILTYGEKMLRLAPDLGYKFRDVEGRVKGESPDVAAVLVERRCGNFAVHAAVLFSRLVERLAGVSPPGEVVAARRMAMELERLREHLWVVHRLAEAASQRVAVQTFASLTEDVLRVMGGALGHRYGFGFTGPGRVREPDPDPVDVVGEVLEELEDLEDLVEASKIWMDRLHTTCELGPEDVHRYDIEGVPARAAGVARDVRTMDPYYPGYEPVLRTEGDTVARMWVRYEEAKASALSVLRDVRRAEGWSEDVDGAEGLAVGVVEAPPGPMVAAVVMKGGKVKALRFRGPSHHLMHAFCAGAEREIFTDFPFGYAGFGIYFSDADG
ncbi:MAG: NADH-quinone oxidoreductase subunit F [Methanopyri archaeon]|nr:NADH-quinone oxidoreductase subunit F [Methanopyri archaeon]